MIDIDLHRHVQIKINILYFVPFVEITELIGTQKKEKRNSMQSNCDKLFSSKQSIAVEDWKKKAQSSTDGEIAQ